MLRFYEWGYKSVLFILVLSGTTILLACGSWGVDYSEDTLGTGSGSDSAWSYTSSWSIGGQKGSFSGEANAKANINWMLKGTGTTNLKVASGYEQKRVTWTSGGTGHHSAPSDAIVTGQGDGTVNCVVHMDANNSDIDTGSCAALAYGKIIFTGVASADAEVNLNCTFSEGATTISGTLSSSPSVTITTTIGGDIADAQGVNTCSVTNQFSGNISGQLQKGHGTCGVLARINSGANESQASVNTNLSTALSVAYGGTGGPCPELCGTHTH